ncbi:MAG: hypothetical protein AAGI25_13585 [Bacteroidota bacterium]
MSQTNITFYSKTDAQHYEMIINELRKEIENNPDKKYRIILRAIKTAKSRELQKAIRLFCRQNYELD